VLAGDTPLSDTTKNKLFRRKFEAKENLKEKPRLYN
jgi:hypothetical protein